MVDEAGKFPIIRPYRRRQGAALPVTQEDCKVIPRLVNVLHNP